MSLRFLLDTNLLSEATRPRPVAEVLRRLEREQEECATAAPVAHELRYGLRRLPAGRRRQQLTEAVEGALARLPVLPYDDEAARWHADQRARLETAGQVRPHVDGQIAAVAATVGLVLVTRNLKDFGSYVGLQVESWWT